MTASNIYIINAHVDEFFSTPISKLGQNFNGKYRFILEASNWDNYKDRKNIKILNANKNINKLQFKYWKKFNKINPETGLVEIRDLSIKKSEIYFISSNMLLALWGKHQKIIKKVSTVSKLIIVINHYFAKAPLLTPILENINRSYLLCERSPLCCSDYFKPKEQNSLKKHLIIEIPYMPNIELSKCRSNNKINKCAVIGQTHKIWEDHIFFKRTGFPYFHKIRNEFRQKYLSKLIDQSNFQYYGPKIKIELNIICHKLINQKIVKIFLSKFKLYNFFKSRIKALAKFEITDYYKNTKPNKEIYSNYSMIICGEEDILNLPVLGFFEAMMAGCAPLGSLHEYYESIGLRKNFHYIPYDGTYDSALKEVEKIRKNPTKIYKIIYNSIKFIEKNINAKNSINLIKTAIYND